MAPRILSRFVAIPAFSNREVAFGLFVLLVGAVGVLVLLPPGLKSRAAGRRRHRDVFR